MSMDVGAVIGDNFLSFKAVHLEFPFHADQLQLIKH